MKETKIIHWNEKHRDDFEELKLEKDSEYETVDMKMQLKLRDLNHKY